MFPSRNSSNKMTSDSQFARIPTIHHVTNSMDGSEAGGIEVATYTVHIPPTPDNQPMQIARQPSTSQRVEDQYASSSLFTGGYNCVTRAHLKEKVIESDSSHPQMTGAKGSNCAMPGCDGKVVSDERGIDIVPCECDFKICRACYRDVMLSGEAVCPGCTEPYRKDPEFDEVGASSGQLSASPSSGGMSKMERRLSLMKSTKSALVRSQTNDFEHNQWLFETKGSYGYGNAMWPTTESSNGEFDGGIPGDPHMLINKQWRPLTRKMKISAAVLSPYRYTFHPISSFLFS